MIPCMMRLQPLIAAFIGHVLRTGMADDPDWAFDAADELFPTLGELNPEFAADSAFGTGHDEATRNFARFRS
jgi:hypothetical protein